MREAERGTRSASLDGQQNSFSTKPARGGGREMEWVLLGTAGLEPYNARWSGHILKARREPKMEVPGETSMNSRRGRLTLCVALLMVLSCAHAVNSESSGWRVVPGLRIGPLALNDEDSKVPAVLGKPGAVCVDSDHLDSRHTITELYYPNRGLEIRIWQLDGPRVVMDISVSTNLEKVLVDRPRMGRSSRTCTPSGKMHFKAPKNFYFTDRGIGLGVTVRDLVAAHGTPLTALPYDRAGTAQCYYYPGITFTLWNGVLLEMLVRDPAFRPYAR